ncbi:collagen alpha-1(VII) chain [Ceratobasidium sp. AG-Ba]|nr:collagen alpha-1(VII) chain [Ceratobasidium sp. AG-Ba]
MSAPTLQPLAGTQPLGTPAAEWAQQTVQAIDPAAIEPAVESTPTTGLVTDAHGNPTTDHSASAIGGSPGHGVNSDKTAEHLDAIKANAPKATEPIPLAKPEPEAPAGNGAALTGPGAGGLFTDAHGNPTTDPNASALEGTPAAPPTPGYAANSTATTPGAQLPGGWIRGPESRQNSMAAPQTSLYEDVSSALDTIGHAAFAAIPSSVIGNLSNSPPTHSPAPDAHAGTENGAAKAEDTPKEQVPPSPPARTASPGFLSRAQGMLSGFLARPASPAAKLPAPDAPTTTGDAALVGGGAVAATANKVGDNIAAGQDLGGHDPKGVLADEPNLLSEGTAARTGLPEGANTAAKFLDSNVATPDPSKPPQDPGLSGSVFPVLADDPSKQKQTPSANQPAASTISPDEDVQIAAANKANRDSATVTNPGASKSGETSEPDRPQPTVTKVSDSGVKDQLLNVRDAVVAPFAGSRAPKSDDSLPNIKSPESGSGTANLDQSNKTSGNAEGIRTTENPHTAHTELAPVRESGKNVGGTGIADPKTTTGGADGKNLDGTSPGVGNGTATTGNGVTPEANGSAGLTHIPGVSIQGNGTGKIVAHEDGGIKAAEAAHAEKEKEKEKEKSGGGVSRLWSRSRTSVDAAGRRGSVDEASKSPTGTRRSKSRFNEEGAATGSESGSTPASPSSSRFKVPLKDKIKGELKIISGKISKNETKVEEGIALKTGHASESAVSPK